MLDTLDILIGFSVIMLVISMAVTMITQAIGSSIVNLRGWCLKQGISRLLALMDEGLKLADARAITDHVLRNPLVGQASILTRGRGGGYALATVIHREELIRLLLDFAIPGDAEKAHLDHLPAEERLRHVFRRSLKNNGIDDPDEVLQSVRNAIVELEKSHPEMSHCSRVTVALLNFAASNFLSKFNTWFDQSMDRVSDLFTRQIRAITAIVALLLAVVLQLDSIALINRLSVDEELRNALVQKAIAEEEALGQQVAALRPATRVAAPATPAAAGGAEPGNEAAAANGMAPADDEDEVTAGNALDAGNESASAAGNAVAAADGNAADPADNAETPTPGQQIDAARRSIEDLGIVALPRSFDHWWTAWTTPGDRFRWAMLFGILLSAALLSLGAPFWYAVLANLLKMRSVIARKDEVQRTERQTTQGTVVATGSAAIVTGDGALPPALAGSERGDLAATG